MIERRMYPEAIVQEAVADWAVRRYSPNWVETEWRLAGGRLRIDVAFSVGPTGYDNVYLVECKAGTATARAVRQLLRYMDYVRDRVDPVHRIFGLLVAPQLSISAELPPFMSFLATSEL